MGRHKKDKTEEEMAAQKKKWWGPERNQRRRNRYATDSVYKTSINQCNRDGYRIKNGVMPRDCRENAKRLVEFGTYRNVAIDGFVEKRLTFTIKELAEVLGYHRIVLYRWHKEGKFPPPNVELVDETYTIQADKLVYTEPQVKRLLVVLGAHQASKQYLHRTDTATIHALFNAMEGVK